MRQPITADLDNITSVRLYEDSRPNNLETGRLQKGLVLVYRGKEIIDEGMGFGAPVVLYPDRTFYSSSAETSFYQTDNLKVLTKKFVIDTISRRKLNALYINDRAYHFFHKHFHNLYTQKKALSPILTKLIELTKIFGVSTEFQKVDARGSVTIKYLCSFNLIEIEVSLSEIKRDYKEIAILNEQGASFFRKYSDTAGLVLLYDKIGAWELVKADAASFSQIDGKISFSLSNKSNSRLLRGRENIKGLYSWVGFCYFLDPNVAKFRYEIKLRTNSA
jgi:hypothetical protein